MTGIMSVMNTARARITYGAGLRNTTLGSADTSPISVSVSSSGGQVSYNYTWIGYFKPAATGTVNLGVNVTYNEQPSIWGSGSNNQAYLWFGTTAISGYTTGNANASATASTYSPSITGTYSPSVVAGNYYPIRLNWQTTLPVDFGFFGTEYVDGSFSFLVNSSTTVTNLVYYNTVSNGF